MKCFICAAFPSTEKYLYQTHWPPWHVIHNVFKQCTLHAELRTVGQNTRRGCLKAFGNTLFNHMSSQSRLLGPLARWALSVFEYADSTHPLDTCSHTVKPSGESSPTVKMVFQESRSFFCSTFCLLHDHSTPWWRGWAHLLSKHQRYKPDAPKGETVLMHPSSKSQTQTGSRHQRYFLNKSNELFATGNVDKRTGAGCQSRFPSCLFWVTGHHHLLTTASAGGTEGTWFSWSKLIFKNLFWQ